MIKRINFLSMCMFCIFLSSVSYASCPPATPNNSSGFCSSFKISAQCHCSASLPAGMCTDMKSLYDRMISMFGSLSRACAYQRETSAQNCIDAWNCYRLGGTSSSGLCSGTGLPCESF